MIYGSTNVAYSPLSPSPSSLLSSQDGQYAIITRDQLHLLTPKLPELTSIQDQSQSQPRVSGKSKGKGKGKVKAEEQDDEEEPITSTSSLECTSRNWSFTKTLLKVEKKNIIKWSDWVDDSEVITAGQLDPQWRSATFSPTGISNLGGCVLATLTTNAEVFIFESPKDAQKGEWEETFDLTSRLANELVNDELPRGIEQTPKMRRELSGLIMRAQASCIEWSGPITFDQQTTKDLSILAVGHRSGEISLWRYEKEKTRCLGRFRPRSTKEGVNWITGLKWSEWRKTSQGTGFEVDLAISDADGRLWIQTISQTLSLRNGTDREGDEKMGTTDEEEEKVEFGDAKCFEVVGEKDRRSISQLMWIEQQSGERSWLVYTKLGTVNLVRLSLAEGTRVIEVEENKEVELVMPLRSGEGESTMDARWNGSSNWSICAGILCDVESNSILIQLSSSLIYHLSLSLPLPSTLSPSLEYTRESRTLFEYLLQGTSGNGVKRKKLSLNDGAKLLGCVPIIGDSKGKGKGKGFEFGYIFETERPDSFNYKPPSTVKTWFAIVNLGAREGEGEEGEEELLKRIEMVLKENSNALDSPPHQALLPILDSISLYSSSPNFVTQLETILTSTPANPALPLPSPPPPSGSIGERVMTGLYGSEELECLRKKEAIAKRLAVQLDLPPNLSTSVKITQLVISRQLIKLVIEALTTILSQTPSLSESEKALFSRLLLTSSALPTLVPPDQDPDSQAFFARQDIEQLSTGFESNLSCPACKAPVPLSNVRKATCLKGHQWERCSITLEIVSNVNVKTCSGCGRKCLVPPPSMEEGEDDWKRVREVLGSVKSCGYCRGRWMRIR
ncbi:hypothetical protein JCM5353_006047 [Sporobolomyces roseus]